MDMLQPLKKVIFLTLITFLPVSQANEDVFYIDTEKHQVKVTILTRGLSYPWGMAFLPDGNILITEKMGRLLIADSNGALFPDSIEGLPKNIKTYRQGGLLDVALHPQFKKNRWLYLSYSGKDKGNIGTEVVRAKLVKNRLEDLQLIFRAIPKAKGGNHFGSRLVFDRRGKLFITLGERGDRAQAQQLDAHPGSTIRLNDDGSVPEDNPFVKEKNAKPEIYSYGNRNPQGLAMHPVSGQVWAHEHGPQGGDEINILRSGANYGWPVITYGVNYGVGTRVGEGHTKEGMEQPIHYWVPSIAPSGMAFYDADKFLNWKGDLFVGSLKFQQLVRLQLKGEKVLHEERFLTKKLGRIRDVRVGPDGFIYVLTDAANGLLARLEPRNR